MSVSPKWLGGYRGHRGHRGQKGDGLRGGRRDILADIISALNSHLKKYKKYFLLLELVCGPQIVVLIKGF